MKQCKTHEECPFYAAGKFGRVSVPNAGLQICLRDFTIPPTVTLVAKFKGEKDEEKIRFRV